MELNGAIITICDYYEMSLASGDATDGIWTYTCTIPETVQGGTYTAIPYAQDTVGNWTNTTNYPTQATFTVTGGIVDGDGPEMPEFSVSSTSVEPGDSLTLSVRAIDATGVSLVGFSMELNAR